MYSFLRSALLVALAGRALAFTITVGKTNLTSNDILSIPDGPVKAACTTSCNTATTALKACNDDVNCLCRNDTVASLVSCEQCMFTTLINTNKEKPDFRAGSAPVLNAYSAACKTANITLAPTSIALKLPPSWDGPFVAVLPLGGAVATVITGAFLGVSAIYLLSNM